MCGRLTTKSTRSGREAAPGTLRDSFRAVERQQEVYNSDIKHRPRRNTQEREWKERAVCEEGGEQK